MRPFPSGQIQMIEGTAMVLAGEDIDTDRIIPARFLKCVSFEALADQVFADDRSELNGQHPFDQTQFRGASILVVNGNFGCGSSREHAPQALMRWGIRAVVGVSFAEIFYGNCLALGIPCATASADEIASLQEAVLKDPACMWSLNLTTMRLAGGSADWALSIDPGPRDMLYSGRWDATSQLLDHGEQLQALMGRLPYLNRFAH